MSDERNIRDFVRWSDVDPLALVGQLHKRVKDAVEAGQPVGFVAVLVTINEDGTATYNPCYNTVPTEIMLMCARMLERRADGQVVSGE